MSVRVEGSNGACGRNHRGERRTSFEAAGDSPPCLSSCFLLFTRFSRGVHLPFRFRLLAFAAVKTIHPPSRSSLHRSTALALLSLAAGVATTRADTIAKEATFDTLTFSDYYAETGYSERYEEFRASSSPTLTADFSTLGDTTLTFTWAAPEGQAFELYVPTGLGWEANTDYFLQFNLQFNNSSGGIAYFPTLESFSLGGASGTALPTVPSDVNMIAVQGTSATSTINAQVTYGGLVVGERYRFQSATLTVSFGASYTGVFQDAPLLFNHSFLTGYIYADDIISDPGQILSLVSVPEPANAALLASVFAAGFCLRRRRRS